MPFGTAITPPPKKSSSSQSQPKKPTVKLGAVLQEYDTVRTQIDQLTSRKNELAEIIKSYASSKFLPDDKGNCISETQNFRFGVELRKSVSFNLDRAKSFFKKRNLWDRVKAISVSVDPKKVDELIAEGAIEEDDLRDLVDIRESRAVVVKRLEEEEE